MFRAPVVLFCQNNRWAISVPLEQQTAAPIFRRAAGYRFPGIQVDGNDVLAVYAVTKDAADRARAGGGPTLIEAMTYRMGPHTTADDDSRYRSQGELDAWAARDPIARYRRYLLDAGVADQAFLESCRGEAEERVAEIRAGVVGTAAPPVSEMFDHVFSAATAPLERQRREAVEGA